MECLPPEITDRIFEQVLWANPQDLYRLRAVSKTWKNMIDCSNRRLLKLWCTKCTDEIQKVHLEDKFKTKYPQFTSWLKYCSQKYPMPHIARDVYESRHEFPNLIHNKMSLTKICPPPKRPDLDNIYISGHAFNDEYFAISWVTIDAEPNDTSAVRIYAINDLNNHIREYHIPCGKIHLYCTNTQMFLLLLEYERGNHGFKECISMVEFLVSDHVVSANLPLAIGSIPLSYAITSNQCFTYVEAGNWIRHQRMTPTGFKSNTLVRLPQVGANEPTEIIDVQICDSQLFVSVCLQNTSRADVKEMVIYQYEITQELHDKLAFAGPKVHQRTIYSTHFWTDSYLSTLPERHIYFAAGGNISLKNRLCDVYPLKLNKWVEKNFKPESEIDSITIFPHHVIIICGDVFIVFRGNLLNLMDYATKNRKPAASKCTVIDLEPTREIENDADYSISIIHRGGYLGANLLRKPTRVLSNTQYIKKMEQYDRWETHDFFYLHQKNKHLLKFYKNIVIKISKN